jgi:hypothetical protein
MYAIDERVWLHEMGWNNEIHPYQSFILIYNNLIPSSLDKYQNVLYKHFKQLAWKVPSHFFKWSTHWFIGLHPITKKCLILSKGKRNYMWYMYKMKIGFLTLISKLHVQTKRCITNSISKYPKLCKIQLQHVKIQCEVGRLFICRVGKVYCGHDKLQCKFGKV